MMIRQVRQEDIPKGYEIVSKEEVAKYTPQTRPDEWRIYDPTYPREIKQPPNRVKEIFLDFDSKLNRLDCYGCDGYVIFIKPIENTLSLYRKNRRCHTS